MSKEKDTYTAKYECKNCEFIGPIKIEKGTEKPDVADCPICGCKTCRPHVDLPKYPWPTIIHQTWPTVTTPWWRTTPSIQPVIDYPQVTCTN